MALLNSSVTSLVSVGPGERLLGGLGYGLSEAIQAGYRWLIENFQEGDQVFLFGFSRGAYSARSLSGLIRKSGLLRQATDELIERAYALYRHKEVSWDSAEALAFRAEHSREIAIEFIGVWDTVGRLGIPISGLPVPFTVDRYRFHDTALSSIVRNAYQVLAIDEHREDYTPTLWTDVPPGTWMEQRWFVGAHTDVDGGEANDPLSVITLNWMQQKAQSCGLALNALTPVPPGGHLAPTTDSFREFLFGLYAVYKLGYRYYRPIGTSLNEEVDESALRRQLEDRSYRPMNPGFPRGKL